VRRGAFNPDGTRLVTAGADRLAIVWAVQTGEQLLTLTAHSASINQARFTPDGQRITTANDDGTTRVWDAANGRELFTLLGQAGAVLDLVISLDGTRIATSGADKLVNFYILDPDDLVKYARSLASRPLTDEESQRYLQTESCTINFEMP
jgi:WD40 repeat protein